MEISTVKTKKLDFIINSFELNILNLSHIVIS